MTAAEILLAIRALAGLARTLTIEDREATPEELDAVDLKVQNSEERLREAIRRFESEGGSAG